MARRPEHIAHGHRRHDGQHARLVPLNGGSQRLAACECVQLDCVSALVLVYVACGVVAGSEAAHLSASSHSRNTLHARLQGLPVPISPTCYSAGFAHMLV